MSEYFTPPVPDGHIPDGESIHERLAAAGRALPYPATPDVASAVRERLTGRRSARRRWWLATALITAMLLSMLAVPQVRAAVTEFFIRIGVILIATEEPTVTVAPTPATAAPSPTPLQTIMDLAGVTTLQRAISGAPFTLRMPTYPTDLGTPDGVFLQQVGGVVVVFVWLESDGSAAVSLHQLGPDSEPYAMKGDVKVIQAVTVNGQPGLWLEGRHVLLYLRNGRAAFDLRRLVEGRVLVWTEVAVTYRLETKLPLNEALKIAASLRAVE